VPSVGLPSSWSWQQILYHYYTNVEFQQKHTFTANYYNDGDTNPDNDFMPSKLVASQADVSIDYNWSGVPQDHGGNPIPGMPADYFSVRWTGQINVTDDSWYTFHLTSDDGARLYVDGNLIVDDWSPAHLERTRSGAIRLASGGHSLRLDYYEATDTAVVRMSWLAGQGLVGAYYNDYDEAGMGGVGGGISGDLVMTRPDVPLHYHWPVIGADPPRLPDDVEMSPKISADPARPMVPGNHFSVRWEGSVWADQPGVYTFTIRTDDGLRLWVDEQMITDDWNNGEREHESKVLLSSGRHEVRLEYYEQIWNAYAELIWAWSGMPEEIYLPIVMKNYQ
jgi:MSHA biogenesis protein MshQ